jgi:hypothetical protein
MHGSMSAAGGNQASRLSRAAQAPPADPTATPRSAHARFKQRLRERTRRHPSRLLVVRFERLRVDRKAPASLGSQQRWHVRTLITPRSAKWVLRRGIVSARPPGRDAFGHSRGNTAPMSGRRRSVLRERAVERLSHRALQEVHFVAGHRQWVCTVGCERRRLLECLGARRLANQCLLHPMEA